MKRKRNDKLWKALEKKQSDFLIQAGWFEQSKYSNGAPIGGIAAVQNYGAVIHNPGGQPFFKDKEGNVVYASKSSPYAGRMAKTKPHVIVIPPTHFWETCKEQNLEKWRKAFKDAWTSVFLGNIEPEKAMNIIGGIIRGDIVKAIRAVNSPPLAESTIKAKLKPYKDQKTIGGLTKRLENTGQMGNSVMYKVEKK